MDHPPNVSFHETLRGGARAVFSRIEETFDAPFGGADNPLRHLGALGFYFLWIVTVSGLYLYTVLDTSIEGVYTSIGYLSKEQWYLGGILRSLHRYASDAFILMTMLHLVREWAYGRYYGFRLYSWVTGVPLLWLMFFSGIGGYWIVWDRLAQFSAIASVELLDWIPIFNDPAARNFLTPEAMNDRFFTLLVFIHLGVPLMLILGLWAHVHRISQVDHFPARRLALGTLAALLALALVKPALSDVPADLSVVATGLRLDWFILFLHPLTDATSPGFVWALLSGITVLLFVLPLLPHPKADPVAVVNAANCNGCGRCLADCPYAAITMEAHPDKPGHKIAIVDADLCAACGICAGSCPSSTPFRSQEELVTGIDMPQQPVNALRRELEQKIAGLGGATKIIVFGCDRGAAVDALATSDTAVMSLMCTGMLPPAFVEYALRGGADGVLVTGCRACGCEFRLGEQWTAERLVGRREPHLRTNVPAERLHLIFASASDGDALARELKEFRTRIETRATDTGRPLPYHRRTSHHD
ncbi:MAG: hydrogenase iron-sulfur subunit [Rhodocyclaceae bacterium]|nr:hydrogenase iron-sulfur subunit [Rhodocyclaceae bacterium]